MNVTAIKRIGRLRFGRCAKCADYHLVHVRPGRSLLGQDDSIPAQYERRRNKVPLQTIRQSPTKLETEVVKGNF